MIEGTRPIGAPRPVGAARPFGALRPLGAATMLALAVVSAAAVAPMPVRAADASADGIVIVTAARYELAADDARVRVTVDLEATNVSAGSDAVRFTGIRLPVHDESARVRALGGGRALTVRSTEQAGFDEVTVTLSPALLPGASRSLTITYDLPGGAPRSESNIRVGRAFATFPVWAFGDVGSVDVVLPRSFTVDVVGDALTRRSSGGETVLSATVSDTGPWVAWVTAHDRGGLTRERLRLPDGEAVVIRGWPEDAAWVARVSDVLTAGLPELRSLIGLPWPVNGDLDVVEVYTPLLEGYAGFFDPDTDRITISEELDEATILHEAAHAWFNQVLWDERWINEGFAEAYTIRTLEAIERPVPESPAVSPDDGVAFPLAEWSPPRAILDVATFDAELYGYDASLQVIRSLIELTGEAGMRAVLAAARDGTAAYLGEGRPEPWSGEKGWRRLLDLAEERGGAEDAGELFAEWVASDRDLDELEMRAQARAAYDALVEAGDGWLPPYAIRQPMGEWNFRAALDRIEVAEDVLRGRDETAAAATALGLSVPPGLEAAYEGTSGSGPSLAAALDLAERQARSLEDVREVVDAVAASRDGLAGLGLLGESPEAELEQVTAAWEAGRFDATVAGAERLVALLAGASQAGITRLVVGAGAGLVALVLVVAAVMATSRRRGRFATLRDHPSAPAPEQGDEPT